MFRCLVARAAGSCRAAAVRHQGPRAQRFISATPALRYGDDDYGDLGNDEEEQDGDAEGVRVGRPFLDPRAPRRQDEIRNDPRLNGSDGKWGGIMDILEHAAYCDGQREEDPDGFFFDETRAEYCSDCDGDPFANGYLTEDEIEFPDDYQPQPYIPGRIKQHIHFLYTVRNYTVRALSQKYHISSERVSAIIALQSMKPQMKASGRYSSHLDSLLTEFYKGGQRFQKHNTENWGPDYDLGVNYTIMADDQMPDDVYPIRRRDGAQVRLGHKLPKLPVPPRSERLHHSRFVFRDISGRKQRGMHQALLKIRMSDFNGDVRPATNLEALYRSWEGRYWSIEQRKGRGGLPFYDEDANAPAHDSVAGFKFAP